MLIRRVEYKHSHYILCNFKLNEQTNERYVKDKHKAKWMETEWSKKKWFNWIYHCVGKNGRNESVVFLRGEKMNKDEEKTFKFYKEEAIGSQWKDLAG